MTKTTKKSRRVPFYRRPLTILLFIVLIFLFVIGSFLWHPWYTPDSSSDDSSNTPQPSANHSDTDDAASTSTTDSTATPPDKVVQYEGDNPNQLAVLTGSIARASVSGDTLTVVASIDQFLNDGGDCHLYLKRDGASVYDASLSASADVSTSVCGPFVVPVSQLTSGEYLIEIIVTSPDKTGTITQTINL